MSQPARMSKIDQFRAPRVIFWTAFLLRVAYITLGHTYRITPINNHFEFGWETGRVAASLASGHGYSSPFSGDTGPTDRLWEVLNTTPKLKAMLMEVSFPNDEQRVATLSGHHTPKTLAADLKKFEKAKDLPFLLYHIKPSFQDRVERELAKIKGVNLDVLSLGDQFIL